MVRQRSSVYRGFVVGMFCLFVSIASAQIRGKCTASGSVALEPSIGRSAGNNGALTEFGIPPKAMRLYERAVRELHQGQAARAEKDAMLQTHNHDCHPEPLAQDLAFPRQNARSFTPLRSVQDDISFISVGMGRKP